MKRKDKEKLIKEYAIDLMDLAVSYQQLAAVIEKVPANIVDAMLAVRETGNQIHNELAETLCKQ